jgi:hypothetical protein
VVNVLQDRVPRADARHWRTSFPRYRPLDERLTGRPGSNTIRDLGNPTLAPPR